VIQYKQSDEAITVQTIISAPEWNESVKTYYNSLSKALQHHYNLKFTRNFTCLKFDVSGIIDDGFSIDEFWQKLKVVHKKEQYDNVQQSTYEKEIYGYSQLWSNEIDIEQERINFQMAIKNNAANKKEI